MYKVIPHKEQRYNTCGDWDEEGNISVSDTGDPNYNALVALHEFAEFLLCKLRGISDETVTAFDTAHLNEEPGENKDAPYYREHQFATLIERMMAHELGVSWNEYEKKVNEL